MAMENSRDRDNPKLSTKDSDGHFLKETPLEFKFVEIDQSSIPTDWEPGANSVLLTRCRRCGRFTEDMTVDIYGGPMPDHMLSEDDRNPLCQHCMKEDLGRALEDDTLATLERKLGLAERHRDALRAFIEMIFTDPEKILKLERLSNRVSGLEKDLSIWKWVAGISAGVALSALGLAVTALLGS
jgi:hypothetical protein